MKTIYKTRRRRRQMRRKTKQNLYGKNKFYGRTKFYGGNKFYGGAHDYIKENTEKGLKIMLIVGAVPEQRSKFIIPTGYAPVFIEDDKTFSTYSETITPTTKEKNFSEYPLIIGTAPYDLPKRAFDLIVFDNGVIKFNPLTKTLINEYKALLRNAQSLLVLDNIYKASTQPFNIYLRTTPTHTVNIDVVPLDLLNQEQISNQQIVVYPRNKPIIHISTTTKLLEYTTQMYLNGTKKLDGNGLMNILAINLWEMFGDPAPEVLATCPSMETFIESPPRMAICLSNVFHSGNKTINLPYIYVGGSD